MDTFSISWCYCERKSNASGDGRSTSLSRNNRTGFYLLEGEAIFYLDDEEYRLKAGDSLYIKKNAVHKIAHQSAATTRFLVIFFPGNINDNITI